MQHPTSTRIVLASINKKGKPRDSLLLGGGHVRTIILVISRNRVLVKPCCHARPEMHVIMCTDKGDAKRKAISIFIVPLGRIVRIINLNHFKK